LVAPDPEAATRAWLARIPEARQLAARAYTDAQLIAWCAGGALFLLACVLIARGGVLGRLRRAIEGERQRPWLAAATLAGALGLVLGALNAIVGGISGWWSYTVLMRGGGVPAGSGIAQHLAQTATGILPGAVAAAILVPPLLWLMRRLPRTWPVVAGAVVTGLILLVGWLPYALSIGPNLPPAPPGAARDGVLKLIAETHLPARGVQLVPNPSFDADVTGGFGQAKVVIGPDILAGPAPDARAYLGHLMGHYVHSDILIVCLVVAAVLTAGFFAARFLAAPLARRLGARLIRQPFDPEVLPALAIIGFLTLTAAGLAGGAYLRWANVRADAYSLDNAREPDGLAIVVEREWDHNALEPPAIETAIFYTHPPLSARIRHAMTWKATHGG